MPQQANYVEVARIGDAAIYRVVGLGNMLSSPAVWGLADRLIGEGVSKFVFEMSLCTGLDSTFTGMLVGLTHQVKRLEQGGWVCVVNASERARASLAMLGADKFVEMRDTLPLDDIIMQRLEVGVCSRAVRLEVIRRAHETLVAMDRANRERFGSFLESLEREMRERAGEGED